MELQGAILGGQDIGRPAELFHDRRLVILFQMGNEAPADGVPKKPQVAVGLVLAMRQAA